MSYHSSTPKIRLSQRAQKAILTSTHDHCSVTLSIINVAGFAPSVLATFASSINQAQLSHPPIYVTDFFESGVDEAFNILVTKRNMVFGPTLVDENYIQKFDDEFNRLVLFTESPIAMYPLVFPPVAVSAKRVYLPGDIIEIKVGGRPFQTRIDPQGTQRFVGNSAVRLLVDGLDKVFDNTHMKRLPFPPGYKGLNELSIDYQMWKITLNDYIDFHAMLGYSVCGFADIFSESVAPIENPLWD